MPRKLPEKDFGPGAGRAGFAARFLPLTPVLTGGLAGSAFGPVGTLVGAGVATLGLFGLGVYGEKLAEYEKAGIPEGEREMAAFKQALIEGGIETASSLLGLKIFGADKFITQPLKSTLKELIETPVSAWGKKLATDALLNEVPTEMLQEALGAEVETGLGLQEQGRLAAGCCGSHHSGHGYESGIWYWCPGPDHGPEAQTKKRHQQS